MVYIVELVLFKGFNCVPYRAKLCRAKFSSGGIIRRAKFWSLSEKFVTFARRKIPYLSYFMRTQYNLYISAPPKNYSSGEIFVSRNYSSGEIFVTWRKIRHFRPPKFRPMRYIVERVLFKEFNGVYRRTCTVQRV